ncbi:hypothetical protein CEXT_560371 [Caerostris extrusa]|uniref:Maturase K n=1 Tax=Caerostris extrusa TaxID=172846 RepID=A0AAV4MJV8_CAEEX|nr:hypothetical protein CEXT_560371 [Caerostris extrusa]
MNGGRQPLLHCLIRSHVSYFIFFPQIRGSGFSVFGTIVCSARGQFGGRSDPDSSWSAPRSLLEADLISILSLAGRYRRDAVIGREHQLFQSDERRPTAVAPALLETRFILYLLSTNTREAGFPPSNYCFALRREAAIDHALFLKQDKTGSRERLAAGMIPNSSWSAPSSLLEAELISILSLAGRYRRDAVVGREHHVFTSDEWLPTAVAPALLEVMFHTLSSFLKYRGSGFSVFRTIVLLRAERQFTYCYLLCSDSKLKSRTSLKRETRSAAKKVLTNEHQEKLQTLLQS